MSSWSNPLGAVFFRQKSQRDSSSTANLNEKKAAQESSRVDDDKVEGNAKESTLLESWERMGASLNERRKATGYVRTQQPFRRLVEISQGGDDERVGYIPSTFSVWNSHPSVLNLDSNPEVDRQILRGLAHMQWNVLQAAPNLSQANGLSVGTHLDSPYGKILPHLLPEKEALGLALDGKDVGHAGVAEAALKEMYDGGQFVLYMARGRSVLRDLRFRNVYESGTSGAPSGKELMKRPDDEKERFLSQRRYAESEILLGEAAGTKVIVQGESGERSRFELKSGLVSDQDRPKFATVGIKSSDDQFPAFSVYNSWIWRVEPDQDLSKRITMTLGDSLAKPDSETRVPFRWDNWEEFMLALVAQITTWSAPDSKSIRNNSKDVFGLLARAYPGIRGVLGVKGNKALLKAANMWEEEAKKSFAVADLSVTPTVAEQKERLAKILRMALNDSPGLSLRGSYLEAQIWGDLPLEKATALAIPHNEVLSAQEQAVLKEHGIKVYRRGRAPEEAMTLVEL